MRPDAPATVDRIAGTALALLERDGASGVTMRRVADGVGVTPMAIYHHFANREALLQAVTDAEFEKLRGYIQAAAARTAAPLDRLIEMMIGYLDYALARPRVFDYVFSEPRAGARQFPGDFEARRSPTLTLVADAVWDAMDNRRLKRDDVWEIALELWALMHGYAVLYLGGRFTLDEKDFRELCRRAMRRMLNGIGA